MPVNWRSQLDLQHPCWDTYRSLLLSLPGDRYPSVDELNALLPPDAANGNGQPVRCVEAEPLAAGDYETRIHRSGEISTRGDDLHDLFNALAWARFPRIKSALNALHVRHMEDGDHNRRGPVRDALTLFDEGGAIMAAPDLQDLRAVATHDWASVFGGDDPWSQRYRLEMVGHGLLEKCAHRYPAITANTLLLQVPATLFRLPADAFRTALDGALAGMLLRGDLLASPQGLAPLPLMGIPGWWQPQDEAFYSDRSVFRPPRAGRPEAPVLRMQDPGAATTRVES